jgi:tetratricopeptide (TPR) repeat protein
MKRTAMLFAAIGLCAGILTGVSSCATYHKTVVIEKETKKHKGKGHAGAADRHFSKGVKFYNQGRYKKAIKQFQKSLAKNPGNWEAQYYLGMSHREVHEFKLSTYRLDLALHQAPKNPKVKSRIHTAFGLTYELAGQPRKASGSYSLALELNPRNSKARKGFDRVSAKGERDHGSHGSNSRG